MNTTPITASRGLITCGVIALVTLGSYSPAAGLRAKPETLWVGGGGGWTLDDSGQAVVSGPALVADRHGHELLPATLTATLTPDDGSLPEPDTCEPADATFVVEGKRDVAMTLAGTGTVCAIVNPFAPTFVIQEFDGRFHVIDAKRRNLQETDGSFSLTLTPSGFASALATSFMPET